MFRRAPLRGASLLLLAVLALAGCVPEPTRTATPSPDAATPTAATPAPAAPSVAFDGDCARVLTPEELEAAAGPGLTLSDASSHLLATPPAVSANLGGVTCSWHTSNGDYVGVSVLDSAAVSTEIAGRYSTMQCGGTTGLCEIGRVVDGAWIGVSLVPRREDPWAEMSDEDVLRETDRLEAVIRAVAAKTTPGMAVARPRDAGWWTIPDCEQVRGAVEATLDEPMTAGFPGDSVPAGLAWEVLVEAGAAEWCSSYSTTEASSTIAEVYPQPGAGRPSDPTLRREDVQEVEVAGADAAWLQVDPEHPSDVALAAVSGANRLTMRFATGGDPTRVLELASRLLAELG
jgi:hypothetical protein